MAAISTFLDYCPGCDRQIDSPGEIYCSQQCRLADLCTSPSSSSSSSSTSMPPTPVTSSHSHSHVASSGNRHGSSGSVSSTSSQSHARHGNAFVLPPAYDFSSHRNSTASNASSSSSSSSSMASSQRSAASITAPRPPSGYFAYAGTGNMLLSSSEAAKKTLSPTSSRGSITSLEDIRNELRAYESGFDVVRDWRRRRASVYDGNWRN